MEFIWDQAKAAGNCDKHKVSFEEASTAFVDSDALRIYYPDHSTEEDRFILPGLSSRGRLLVVSHCYREGGALIRIISARKAKKGEAETYARRK